MGICVVDVLVCAELLPLGFEMTVIEDRVQAAGCTHGGRMVGLEGRGAGRSLLRAWAEAWRTWEVGGYRSCVCAMVCA